jgi:hypothetical protein
MFGEKNVMKGEKNLLETLVTKKVSIVLCPEIKLWIIKKEY